MKGWYERHKPKGSTVCIAVMFIGWIWYICFCGWFYVKTDTWFPVEFTWGTIGLFLVETVSLARLKMAKEGAPIKNKILNPMLKKIGVELPDFEEEVQAVAKAYGTNVDANKPNDDGLITLNEEQNTNGGL